MSNDLWLIKKETVEGIGAATKEKLNITDDIAVLDIENSIRSISAPKPEQNKTLKISTNGNYTIAPDDGYALAEVEITANNPYEDKWDQILNRAVTAITAEDLADVTKISNYVFAGCLNLKTCAMPAHLTSIGTRAFYGCSNLGAGGLSLSIPAGITSIGEHAFGYCGSLTTIRFKGTPSSIAANVFTSSAGITHIYVPWAKGAVANAPWGAANATIHYNTAV